MRPALSLSAFALPILALPLVALTTGPALAGGAHGHDHGSDHAHDAPRREMEAHVHVEGTLDIAVEGGRVVMAFAAPGADIVGFEHAATSDADRAALEAAKATLADPLALFAPSEAAGCAVESAAVTLEGDAADGEHDHGHGHDHAKAEGGHTEFHAEYALACGAVDRLDGFDFAYFARFPNAGRLAVTIVSDQGQRAFTVERGAPDLRLDGGV
jgi:hypothetical protein